MRQGTQGCCACWQVRLQREIQVPKEQADYTTAGCNYGCALLSSNSISWCHVCEGTFALLVVHLEKAFQDVWEGEVGPQLLISDVVLVLTQPLSPEADVPLPQLLREALHKVTSTKVTQLDPQELFKLQHIIWQFSPQVSLPKLHADMHANVDLAVRKPYKCRHPLPWQSGNADTRHRYSHDRVRRH